MRSHPSHPPPPAYAPVILRFDVSILNIWYVIITYLGKYLYPTTIQPLSVLQKKPAVSIMTFSKFDKHSSPLFKKLNIIKLTDLIKYHISIFFFKFHNQLLPSVSNSHFTSVENIHSFNTRATAKKCYYLPKARTNYGLFSNRYQGPKIWNMIEQQIKLPSSIHQFKQKLKIEFFSTY